MTQRLQPAVAPIREDDAFIAQALERASIPTLMMSLVHITGDIGLLRGPIRPKQAVMGEVQGRMSEEETVQVRSYALEVLKAYRDGGCKPPPPPSPEIVHEMMSFLVGEPVPDDYVPMMLEEMALDGEDVRDVHWDGITAERRQAFRVLVIGAGMSGLLAAVRLEEAGIPYTVIEKNEEVGGTWLETPTPAAVSTSRITSTATPSSLAMTGRSSSRNRRRSRSTSSAAAANSGSTCTSGLTPRLCRPTSTNEAHIGTYACARRTDASRA